MSVFDDSGSSSGSSSIGSVLGRSGASVAKKIISPPKVNRTPSRGVASPQRSKPRPVSSRTPSVSRGSSGGGGGVTSPVTAPVKKPPVPPSLADYLGTDSTYQQVVSGGKRSLNDFLSDLTRRKGEAGTQFDQTSASMEHDRTQQLEDLKNEFASRGLINSGLYGQEQGNFQQKFTEQQTALQQQQSALLADLLGQETNYRRENDLSLENAKQEALLRRAQKYNIGA